MKVYHISIKGDDNLNIPLSKLEEGKRLFYSLKDTFWHIVWKHAGMEHKGYDEYEITIPEKSITTSIEPDKKKIFKLTRDNLKDFGKKYNSQSSFEKDIMEDYAGVDATDEGLGRTKAYKMINRGHAPSGNIWRFKGLGLKIKLIESKRKTDA